MVSRFFTLSRKALWISAAGVLLLFAAALAAALAYEWYRVTNFEFQRLSAQARVIDENIVRQLEGANNALLSVDRDWDSFAQNGNGLALTNLRLRALSDSIPGVRTMTVMDKRGEVIASNRKELIGRVFADREYFTTAVRNPDPNSLYLSEPYKSVLGTYSVNLVRVSLTSFGEVERVHALTLDPEFFNVLLSSVRFEDDVWVSLAQSKGALLLRIPEAPALLGQDLNRPGSFFTRHMSSGSAATLLTGETGTTKTPAWMAQRTIQPQNLNMQGAFVVAVARIPSQALETWYHAALAGAIMWIVACLGTVNFLWMVNRKQLAANLLLTESERQRQRAEENVRHMAFYDTLTDLPNRRLLYDRISQSMAASIRHRRYSALLFLDLDGFKQLNDAHGHEKGDQLLKGVALRLQAEIRRDDTAARIGGDEFVIMLAELSGEIDIASKSAAVIAEKVLASLAQDHDLNGLSYRCTASLGLTLFGHMDESIDAIINRADEAMYEAKASGRNAFKVALPDGITTGSAKSASLGATD